MLIEFTLDICGDSKVESNASRPDWVFTGIEASSCIIFARFADSISCFFCFRSSVAYSSRACRDSKGLAKCGEIFDAVHDDLKAFLRSSCTGSIIQKLFTDCIKVSAF